MRQTTAENLARIELFIPICARAALGAKAPALPGWWRRTRRRPTRAPAIVSAPSQPAKSVSHGTAEAAEQRDEPTEHDPEQPAEIRSLRRSHLAQFGPEISAHGALLAAHRVEPAHRLGAHLAELVADFAALRSQFGANVREPRLGRCGDFLQHCDPGVQVRVGCGGRVHYGGWPIRLKSARAASADATLALASLTSERY